MTTVTKIHCDTCTCDPSTASCLMCFQGKHKPGRKATWDVHAMAARIATGELSQSDVARMVGITRQAVEQGIRKHNLRDAVIMGKATRSQKKREDEARRKELRKQERADHTGPTLRDGVPREPVISTEDLIASIKAMYEFLRLDGPMSHFVYNDLRPKHLPSASTIMDRFGTWNAACEAAGLPTSRPSRPIEEYARIPEGKALDDLKRYILQYRQENGRYATISNQKYDEWARDRSNNAVSRAHISKKYGWSDLVGQALKELYGTEPVDATGS